MDIEKLIEDLRGLLKQYGEKIPYGELVGAPWPYSRAGDLVWQDPEPYFIEQAATALSALQAENEKLREKIEDARLEGYAKGLGEMSEENEKLRAELEQVKKKNKYSAHDVALILSDVFGDSCACNFNGNDEWLPEKCELLDACPDVIGVACWEQYLKWRDQKEN